MPYDYYGNWHASEGYEGDGAPGAYGSTSFYGGYGPAYGPGFGPRYAPTWYNPFVALGAEREPLSHQHIPQRDTPWTYNDEEIEFLVYQSLRADPRIPPGEDIQASVTDGVVALSGTVRNRQVKYVAHAVTFWTPGVVDVLDELQVAEPRRRGPRTDEPSAGHTR